MCKEQHPSSHSLRYIRISLVILYHLHYYQNQGHGKSDIDILSKFRLHLQYDPERNFPSLRRENQFQLWMFEKYDST